LDTQGKPIQSIIYGDKPDNEAVYGRLHSWDVTMNGSTQEKAQGIAPRGWHIPDDADWEKLFDALGGKAEEVLRFEVPKTFCHSVRCVKDQV